jgi:hypothetical protein
MGFRWDSPSEDIEQRVTDVTLRIRQGRACPVSKHKSKEPTLIEECFSASLGKGRHPGTISQESQIHTV